MKTESRFVLLLALFLCVMSFVNIVAVKIVALGPFTLSFGSYLYAFTFPVTDVVSETLGKRRAQQVVWLGFFCYIFSTIVVAISILHPPAEFWVEKDLAYRSLLGIVPRITIAGIFAYLIGQVHDVWAFHFWKRITSGKYLWLRNNFSTGSSQLIDSFIFYTIAFGGTVPTGILFKLIISAYLIKLCIAILDTPIVYLLVRWVKAAPDYEQEKMAVE